MLGGGSKMLASLAPCVANNKKLRGTNYVPVRLAGLGYYFDVRRFMGADYQ